MEMHKQNCKGRLGTDGVMTILVPINIENNHAGNEKKEVRQQLRVRIKRQTTDDLTSRPSKIIRNELHKFANQSPRLKKIMLNPALHVFFPAHKC